MCFLRKIMWTYVVVVVLAGALCGRSHAATFMNCHEVNADISNLPFTVALGPADGYNIAVVCPQTCLEDEYPFAGISEGIFCYCSSGPISPLASGTCDLLCDDGTSQCGATENANIIALYETGGGNANFTLIATNDDTAISLSITREAKAMTFLVDLDYMAPPSRRNSLTAEPLTFFTSYKPYIVPGDYSLTVVGTIDGTSLTHVEVANLTQDAVATIDLVECPVVVEPEVEYMCSISVTHANDLDSFTATFSDDSTQFTISGIGSKIYRLGFPVPRGETADVEPPVNPTGIVMLSQYPVTRPLELLAYEFYAYELDTFKAKVMRPNCGGPSCSLTDGACISEAINDVVVTNPSSGLYCLRSSTCFEMPACTTAPAAAAYDDVAESVEDISVTELGFQRVVLAASVVLQQGDMVVIQGPVGRSPEEYAGGDSVDGTATTFHHYVEAVVKEFMPVAVSHQCVKVNEDVSLAVVDDDGQAASLTNHTSCERNIMDVLLRVTQTATNEYDASVNQADPFYVRSNHPATYTVAFSVAGPIYLQFSYDPDFGVNDTFTEIEDFPLGAQLHELTYQLQRDDDVCYAITVAAWNQHNEDAEPITNVTNLCVQHEVLTTWTMTATPFSFKIPSQAATFIFEMTSAGNFPTNASVSVMWGDKSSKETLPFENTNGGPPTISHSYAKDGYYNVSAFIYNIVSGFEVSCQVKIVEEIVDFDVHPKYFPSLDSPASDLRDGFGKIQNQFPLTKNITFIPTMQQGTVAHYVITHTNNGTEVMTFTTLDEFDPTANPFHYHFNFETFLNLTVTAFNEFENVSVDLFLEIVGKVRGCELSDFNLVTAKGDNKALQVTFESVGGGTCLLMNYGDSVPVVPHAYGDELTCRTEFQHAFYHAEPELDVALNFSHVYMEEGVYNLTIIGYNELSNCTSSIATYVSNIRCNPPTVTIPDSTMDVEEPLQFTHSQNGFIPGDITINCEVTSNTKKRWQVYHADPFTAAYREAVIMMHAWKSWDKPDLVIPKDTLDYGFYLATYTVTMWDEVLPVDMPFQRQAVTLFEIIPTPLIAVITSGSVSKISRGLSQEIPLNPCELSIDPDFPEDKNFTVSWRCREVGEDWPDPDPGPTSIWEKGSGGGCFGNGAGTLDHNSCELSIMGSDFNGKGTYEMEVTVSKGERSNTGTLQIETLDYDPPILNMACASPNLCIIMDDGLMVNPCKRIGIIAECVNFCQEPHQYQWEAKTLDGTLFPYNSAHFPNGYNDIQLMFSSQFFVDNPSVTSLHISLMATTADDRVGEATYFFRVNQKPQGGKCNLRQTGQSRALIDRFFVECDDWVDPDGHGIKNYILTLIDANQEEQAVMNQRHTDTLQSMELALPPGNFTIRVKILDMYDGCAEVVVISDLKVMMPTAQELEDTDVNGILEELAGSGNVQLLNTYILAASSVTAANLPLDDESLEGMTEEKINERIVARTNEINKHLDYLKMNQNYESLDSVDVTCAVLAQMLTNLDDGKLARKAIDTEAHRKIINITEEMKLAYPNLNAPDPNDWVPITKNMAVVNTVMGKSQKEGSEREEDGTCSPNILEAERNHKYPTHVSSIDLVLEKTVDEERDCNTLDFVRDSAKKYVPSLWDGLHKLFLKMSKTMVLGENISASSRGAEYTIRKMRRFNFNTTSVGNLGTQIILPEAFCPSANCTMDTIFCMLLVEWQVLLYSFLDTSKKLGAGTMVVDVEVLDEESNFLEISNLSEEQEVEIHIPKTLGSDGNNTLPVMEPVNAIEDCAKLKVPIVYSTFNVSEDDSVIKIQMEVDQLNPSLFVILHNTGLGYGTKYLLMSFVDTWVEEEGVRSLFLLSRSLKGRGRYFFGVAEFSDEAERDKMKPNEKYKITASKLRNITTNYNLRIITDTAFYLNQEHSQWMSDGLRIVESTLNITKIKSNHLTSFGTGMFVAPNTIDFSYVFTHMGFNDNLTIYLTLIISFTILIVLMVWARVTDRKDVQKLGATPLPDNNVEDKYLYEMLIITGNLKGAQTDSSVQFVVSGDRDETDIRMLGDNQRKILRKDAVDVFVMAVPRPLGDLQFLHVWHDNSGLGPNASWYLSFIVFRDVQTGKKYEFIANDWLAVEHGDGQIERLLSVAGTEEKKAFKHLFRSTSNRQLSDEHLWFSVFLRPYRSRFTRCQRVGSCFSMLFLFMLVNAMWYERVPEQPGKGGLQLGPFSLSIEQLGVGLLSNIIVFVPSLIIIIVFRKARPRKLRKNRIEMAVKKMRKRKEKKENEQLQRKADVEDNGNSSNEEDSSGDDRPSTPPKRVIELIEKKKKFTLPWWTVWLGWLLVVACLATSCFFLLMYGITFGNSKATKWVTSLVISFFTDILFLEPVKIFLTAIVLSAVCKTGDLEEDDAEEDEEEPYLEQDEAWLYDEGPRRRTLEHCKINEETLEELRKVRKNEMEMWDIIKEIISYSLFLWVFLALSYSNRDPSAYYLQMHLRNSFIHEGNLDGTDFTKVANADRLWFYLEKGLMGDLRADQHYNGKEPYGLKGFLNDQTNRIMGYATVRQIRIKKNTCSVPSQMQKLSKECSSTTGIVNEEHEDFCVGWKSPTPFTANTSTCSVPEFKYSTAMELKSLPIWGRRDWYGGGGYVIHLQPETDKVLANLKFLQENHWIDTYTRAVLLEFSTYNSQVNLFGLCLLIAEFAPGGGILPTFRFEGIQLLQYQTFGSFIMFCQGVFVLFVIYFTGREMLLMYRQRCKYFQNYWSYAEIAILIACYLGIIIYVLRELETNTALKQFARTHGNGYIRMQFAATLHEVYGYVVGFIVFVGTLKFIKLLRFNKRMGLLSATLGQCWDDLSGFLLAFLFCFFTFVTMFFMLLNMFLFGFHNFVVAVETCFSMMLGKFQFEEMQQVSRLVPIMFFVFVLCNSWVLINLLLTLIIKAFTQVKYDIANQPNEYEMVDFVWKRFLALLGKGNKPATAVPLNTTKAIATEDMQGSSSVKEFPGKIDKFLEYVNSTYFEGNLDFSTKDSFRSSMYHKEYLGPNK